MSSKVWVNLVAIAADHEWTVWSGFVNAPKVLIEVSPGEVGESE